MAEQSDGRQAYTAPQFELVVLARADVVTDSPVESGVIYESDGSRWTRYY